MTVEADEGAGIQDTKADFAADNREFDRHGIEQMVDEGQIDVRAYLKKGHLIFKVTDNGLGIPTAKLAECLWTSRYFPREKDDWQIAAAQIRIRDQLRFGRRRIMSASESAFIMERNTG